MHGAHGRPRVRVELGQHVQITGRRRRLEGLQSEVVRLDGGPAVGTENDRADVVEDPEDDLKEREQFILAVLEIGARCQVGHVFASGEAFALVEQLADGQRTQLLPCQEGLGIGRRHETFGVPKQGGIVDGCLAGVAFPRDT
jgi:hypothetical protein